MFLIPSLLGILLFMAPVSHEGGITIPVAIFSKLILSTLGEQSGLVVSLVIICSAVISALAFIAKPKWITSNAFLKNLFIVSPVWFSVRLLGAVFVCLSYFAVGPEMISGGATGGFIFTDLLPTLLAVFLFAGLFLPLLTNFGLLEMFGAMLSRVMRPLFGLPGRSAVDCATSWLGDGSVAILMSSKQYEQGYYTEREAAVVGTTFSAVSISFSLVVIAQVGLEHMFVPFYLTVCLAGFVAAVVVPRLPPLSWKKDTLANGEEKTSHDAELPAGESVLRYGFSMAVKRASTITSLRAVFKEGLQNALDMLFGVLPIVMAIGTLALIIAEYTSVFAILGAPFVPLLELLHIHEAAAASETMVVGLADMFIPAVLAADINSEMTRFVVAVMSVSQLIYMSEVGALLLGSKIPIKLWEMVAIFLLRTLVTLPVIAGVAHLIF
ncbi:hypothetical protein CS022_05625 [Veronia nyctiphanis]|uniref:Nucleoside transporter/FeoB GTPase Gate domain-containing protein n=2 Tax=Veronia nyctiphanis TaxID=1278244 RepID=A0A4Q0YSN5_9GAMM|nr:YjiH family protein [Veronia nyctiphanis]RXJ74176.1 hypothetical protein CS022_05625 [Veronia nyctiphanis]